MRFPDSLQANGPAVFGSGIGKGREQNMAGKYFSQLKCRECGRTYPAKAVHVCEFDFGPLEADYNYAAIGTALNRKVISSMSSGMPISSIMNSDPKVISTLDECRQCLPNLAIF